MQQIDPTSYVELQNQGPQIIVPQTDTLSAEQQENLNQMLPEQKTQINPLIRFYSVAIFQYIGIFAIFHILQVGSLADFLVVWKQSDWWGADYSYSNFQKYQAREGRDSYSDFIDWKQSRAKDYYHYELRWTYFVFVAFFCILTISLTIGRRYRCFVQYQEKIFYIQTILLGILLGGYAASEYKQWSYSNIVTYVSWSCILLILNAIILIVLVKVGKLNYYGQFGRILAYALLPLNYIIALNDYGYLRKTTPIVEAFLIYSLYYFNQLNHSFINKENLPENICFFENIKGIVNEMNKQDSEKDIESKTHLNRDYFVINKKVILLVVLGIGLAINLITLLVFSSYYLLIITVFVLISLVFETQVASKSLQNGDVFIAASSMYLDFLCPVKNFIRSYQK